jgi:alpha-mannosidase
MAGDTLTLSRRDFLRDCVLFSTGVLFGAGGLIPPWLAALARAQVAPVDPLRLYIALDDHTDLFWTADDAGYSRAFGEMLDYYLDLADATADQPADFQSRFNCDGAYWLWTYERTRPPQAFDRLIARLRSGHITAPLNALVVCLGGAPLEAVLRGMYYPGALERRYGLRFPVAVAMENQTLPYGLGSLWAGSGARYSWKGICGCDTRAPVGPRPHPVYWYGGPDGSRILMKWYSITDNQHLGGYAEARYPDEIIETLSAQWFLESYGYRVAGAFGKGWDDFTTLTDEFVQVARTKSDATRRVIVSNQVDFFADFAATYGDALPVVAESYGNDWDLYCAALSEVTAQVKRAVEALRTAEALAAQAALVAPGFMAGREDVRAQAWMALGLYWEHNFGQLGVYPIHGAARVAWQRQLASDVAGYVDALQRDALAALGLRADASGGEQVRVFNPLSWPRTDAVDLPVDAAEPLHVIDAATGAPVPAQRAMRDGQPVLRFLAEGVPALGWKAYTLRPGAPPQDFPDAATVTGGVIESAHTTLTLDGRGAILSLIDRARGGREWVRPYAGLALNDPGGTGGGTVSIDSSGPVTVTLRADSEVPLAHTTWITVYAHSPRIDIHNEIMQNFDAVQTWTFSAAVDVPHVWHEEVGAVILARTVSDSGHYADALARYDWLTLNHFAAITGADGGLLLSNADCCFMKLGDSTPEALDTATPQIHVLAGGRVGGDGSAGIPDQGGDDRFTQHFALLPFDRFDPAAAMRAALEHQNPLLAVYTGDDAPMLDAGPLLTASNERVLVWAIKPAEDVDALLVRLWNLTDTPQDVRLTLGAGPIVSAVRVTHIETPAASAPLDDGALSIRLRPQQIRSYLIAAQAIDLTGGQALPVDSPEDL